MLLTASAISKLPLDFVKIHNLHIVRYTQLAREYKERPFRIFSFEEWVDFACRVLERLHPDFIIERLYGDAPRHLLIEPQWCRNGARIIQAIREELKKRDTWQGKYFKTFAEPTQESVTV